MMPRLVACILAATGQPKLGYVAEDSSISPH